MPKDNITDDDIEYFSSNLMNDEEYFNSLHRELSQCESGNGVEKIEGNQVNRAIFTLLPADGIC